MKHKLNSFSGAFKGTTDELEGIADALRRKEPTPPIPPGPYVPNSFPIYLKVTDINDPSLYSISMFDNFAQGGAIIVDNGITIAGIYPRDPINGAEIDIEIEYNPVQVGLLFDEPFRIETTQSNYLVEFVDPSTLPQS